MRLTLERLRRTRSDHGFTLIEMVVTVAILGIITATLLGVMLQYLKTATDTSARLNESTDQQFISTYWQNDVSSLGRRSLDLTTATFSTEQSVFVGSSGPSGCGSAVGSVVVVLAWNDFEAGTVAPADPWSLKPQQVAYVTVPSGSRFVLKRVRCSNGVTEPPLTVAHNLTESPTISCDTSCGSTSLPNRVSMAFVVKDARNSSSQGYTTTVSADRRQG